MSLHGRKKELKELDEYYNSGHDSNRAIIPVAYKLK